MQLRKVLDDFKPDVCHLNNFNYQLTPSIILEIVKWRKETGRQCKIIFTAHDYQLVCPNHQLKNPITHENCEKCLGGHFMNCVKGKCVHGSTAKSIVGMMEAEFWKWNGAYKYIDKIICCSEFLKTKMDTNPLFATKTIAMPRQPVSIVHCALLIRYQVDRYAYHKRMVSKSQERINDKKHKSDFSEKLIRLLTRLVE